MFKRLFGIDKQSHPSVSPAKTGGELERLQNTIEFLEKRQTALQQKMNEQLEIAKKCYKANNKRGAIQAMTRKKQYETQVESLMNQQANMERLMQAIMDQSTNEKVLQTQVQANKYMKQSTKKVNAQKVDDVVSSTTDLMDQVNEVREALQQPLATDMVDESEALEELEAEMVAMEPEKETKPAVVLPPMPSVPTAKLPEPAKTKEQEEEEQLRELEKELAM